jgi:hypothetical protein
LFHLNTSFHQNSYLKTITPSDKLELNRNLETQKKSFQISGGTIFILLTNTAQTN